MEVAPATVEAVTDPESLCKESADCEDGLSSGYVITEPDTVEDKELWLNVLDLELASEDSFERELLPEGCEARGAVLCDPADCEFGDAVG